VLSREGNLSTAYRYWLIMRLTAVTNHATRQRACTKANDSFCYRLLQQQSVRNVPSPRCCQVSSINERVLSSKFLCLSKLRAITIHKFVSFRKEFVYDNWCYIILWDTCWCLTWHVEFILITASSWMGLNYEEWCLLGYCVVWLL
jgi:hypothetical protein